MIDLTTLIRRRYTNLIILRAFRREDQIICVCQCSCGKQVHVYWGNLSRRRSRSCGCLRTSLHTTHGKSHSNEYRIWAGMIQRCHNPKCKEFRYYGKRGIRVCREWRQSFAAFYAHVGSRPSKRYTLDRIKNGSHYEPGNVRWATYSQQIKNQRRHKYKKAKRK